MYDTVLAAKISSSSLMSLGKLIYARTPWKDLPNEWQKLGGNPTGLNTAIRLPLLRAAEEFFLKQLPDIFAIVAEAPAEPEPDLNETAVEAEPAQPEAPVQEQLPLEQPRAAKENGHGNGKKDKGKPEAKPEPKVEQKVEAKPEPKVETPPAAPAAETA